MLSKIKKKYIGDKAFYKKYIMIALPMIIQSAITNFVSLLDNIMVGKLGTEQMAGVAIVNQLFFVVMLANFGIVSAGGIFGSQYFGQQDHEGHMYTFRFRLYASIFASILATVILYLFGGDIISLYLTETDNPDSIEATHAFAMQYLFIMFIGWIPFAITQAYASTVKETEQTFVPMIAGLCGIAANALLDWILIFGIGPCPALGVKGAAIATVISRIIEMSIVVIWAHRHLEMNKFLVGAYKGFRVPVKLFGDIMKKGTPIIINEILWAAGMTVLTQAYSQRGLDVVAAQNIANTINNLFNIVFIQLGACISIIIGQYLGAGDFEKAKEVDTQMIFFSVVSCIFMAALMLITGRFFPDLYNTSDDIKDLARKFILVQAISMPFCAFSHCSYFTLRSGGKTIVTFLFDSAFTWVITVTLAQSLVNFTSLGIIMIFILVTSTELIKNVVGYFMVKSGVWLNKIV